MWIHISTSTQERRNSCESQSRNRIRQLKFFEATHRNKKKGSITMAMAGQTISDRLLAAKYSLAGQGLAKSVCKATTEEMIGPKKKHLDCKWDFYSLVLFFKIRLAYSCCLLGQAYRSSSHVYIIVLNKYKVITN